MSSKNAERKSIVERAKDFKSLSKTVRVPFPTDDSPEIILEINRLAPAQFNGITRDSLDSSYSAKMFSSKHFNNKLNSLSAQLIKDNIVDWEVNDEDFKFSQQNLELLKTKVITIDDEVALVQQYTKAVAEEKKTIDSLKK